MLHEHAHGLEFGSDLLVGGEARIRDLFRTKDPEKRHQMVCLSLRYASLSRRQQRQKSKASSQKLTIRKATMSDDQETKPTEETTPKVEEEPKKEEDDKVKEEESTATFEPVVSTIFLWGREKNEICEKMWMAIELRWLFVAPRED